jgi:quercetin dioxygenase-like cupin family protein
MRNFLLMGRGINVLPLALEVLRQGHLWREDTYLRDYPQGPFRDVETIFLRFPPASVSELERSSKDPHECVWMDGALHLPAARPLIFNLLASIQGERLGRVMLNKIAPGGRIYPHADTPVHAEYYSRFHYVVMSSPGVAFSCGEEQTTMQAGDLWWFNNKLVHEVVNNSAQDRIHLIIDVRTSRVQFRGLTPTSDPVMAERVEAP